MEATAATVAAIGIARTDAAVTEAQRQTALIILGRVATFEVVSEAEAQACYAEMIETIREAQRAVEAAKREAEREAEQNRREQEAADERRMVALWFQWHRFEKVHFSCDQEWLTATERKAIREHLGSKYTECRGDTWDRNVTINVRNPEGRRLFDSLIARAWSDHERRWGDKQSYVDRHGRERAHKFPFENVRGAHSFDALYGHGRKLDQRETPKRFNGARRVYDRKLKKCVIKPNAMVRSFADLWIQSTVRARCAGFSEDDV